MPTECLRDGTIDPAIVRQAVVWLVRLQSGRIDQRTRSACQAWRQADAEHERAWQRVQALDGDLRGDVAQLPAAAKGCAVQALAAAGRRAERRRALKLLSLALAVMPAAWLAGELAPGLLADHATAIGERRTVTLADGSVLWLNTHSAVQIRFDGEQRLIVLTRGEVHITSGQDAQAPHHRPLRVHSRHALFEALGTRFVVRDDDVCTRLVVEAGAVSMRPARAPDVAAAEVAQAGEAYVVDLDRATPAAAPSHEPAAWIDGLLVADDMRLDAFLAELARHRRAPLSCDESVAGLRLSGVYRLDDGDQLLALLPRVLPVRVETRFGLWTRVLPRG